MHIFASSPEQEFRYLSQAEIQILEKKNCTCSVCLEPFRLEPLSEKHIISHCDPADQHSFHKACAISWLIEQNDCLFCRKQVSWGKISTWKEWMMGCSPVRWNIRCIQSLYDRTVQNPGMKMGLFGGVVILTGQVTNSPLIPPLGFLIQSVGLYLGKNDYYKTEVLPFAEQHAEQLQSIELVARINASSLGEIRALEDEIKKTEEDLKKNASEHLKEKTISLQKLLNDKKTLAKDSSFRLTMLQDGSQGIQRQLSSNKLLYKTTLIAQYAFLCYAIFLFCVAINNQENYSV